MTAFERVRGNAIYTPSELAEREKRAALERQMAIAKKHAGRADAAEDRWNRLREHIALDAETEQEIADDYGDMGTDSSWERANKHWGKAEALREVLAAMDRMEAE